MQRFVGLFIGILVLIDAFFIAYAVGLNVKRTTIVDPNLPIIAPKAPPAEPSSPTEDSTEGSPLKDVSSKGKPIRSEQSSDVFESTTVPTSNRPAETGPTRNSTQSEGSSK